ncbi:MAG: threonine synthase [Treponema sp.]|nr:threonine synthase [Treponema sp.]
MIYTDTRDSSVKVDFKTAVVNGMNSKTGGLYIPVEFPRMNEEILNSNVEPSFRKVAFEMAKPFVDGEIPDADLEAIIADAYPFSPELAQIDKNTFILELFHGPTCAFKDFGARFMARVMSYFNRGSGENLHILVATSGDTGSAVGSAFHNVEGIDVTILYPEGKISKIQEKQLSTFTGNVRAIKINGTFDDCQKLVKTAFTDEQLRNKFKLSSANSINISRLLPQGFYYMYSSLVLKNSSFAKTGIDNPAIIMTVPSGNFGNLTSGLIAQKMGAPIAGFVAATNSNRTIPDWIATGKYEARPSVETLANAMDVGAPSNYERIAAMYSLDEVKKMFGSYWTDNAGITEGIKECHANTGYTIDPHGAVGYKAWQAVKNGGFDKINAGEKNDYTKPGLTANVPEWAGTVADKKAVGIILETADPAKFGSIVKDAIGTDPVIPERLQKVMMLEDRAIPMENDYETFKKWLMENL